MSFGFGFGFPSLVATSGGPSLSLNFVGASTLDPQITFTRASTATYFNSSGVLTSAAIDTPRFDYSPSTLASNGLLIEEPRTNSIRNNTMVGAVAGTPGTAPTNWLMDTTGGVLTRTIVGTGTESGITYIEVRYQFSGAGSASVLPEGVTQIAALSGQTWTSSSYVKLISGGYTNLTTNLDLNEYTSGGGFLAFSTLSVTATSSGLATQRALLTRTLTQATTAFIATNFRLAATGAADITLRIGLPQLELGAFPTSVIPTTTAAATRAADLATITTLTPWYNATEGTLGSEGILVGGTASTFPYQTVLVGANVNNDLIGINWTANAAQMRFGVRSGGIQQADIGGSLSKIANSSYKVAGRYAANNVQAAFDGVLGVLDTSVTIPTITAFSLGGAAGFQSSANVWLRRIYYYPRSLSNAELQGITT